MLALRIISESKVRHHNHKPENPSGATPTSHHRGRIAKNMKHMSGPTALPAKNQSKSTRPNFLNHQRLVTVEQIGKHEIQLPPPLTTGEGDIMIQNNLQQNHRRRKLRDMGESTAEGSYHLSHYRAWKLHWKGHSWIRRLEVI